MRVVHCGSEREVTFIECVYLYEDRYFGGGGDSIERRTGLIAPHRPCLQPQLLCEQFSKTTNWLAGSAMAMAWLYESPDPDYSRKNGGRAASESWFNALIEPVCLTDLNERWKCHSWT
jgi:hypothetical protein